MAGDIERSPVAKNIEDVHKTPKFVIKIRGLRNGDEILASVKSSSREEFLNWLRNEAIQAAGMLEFFEEFCYRLWSTNFGLQRATLSTGTLHPQVAGFAWHWDQESEETAESQIMMEVLESDSFKKNPVARVVQDGETIFSRIDDPDSQDDYPLFKELAPRGFTGYIALPLRGGSDYYNAVTFATKQEGGFTQEQFDFIQELKLLYCLHVERHLERLIAKNALSTYLGDVAGTAVLNGDIRRGTGSGMRAIIWASDMRGFTETAGRLSSSDMTRVLNAYFDILVQAINEQGGEILKFIGDGLLAVFPYADDNGAQGAANRAARAAQQAQDELVRLNENPPSDLGEVEGWRPLRSGIGLHDGSVFFGNVGGKARLDFTVIGTDVNIAARIEAMTKELKTPILMSKSVADHLSENFASKSLGSHPLKGVNGSVELFAPQFEKELN